MHRARSVVCCILFAITVIQASVLTTSLSQSKLTVGDRIKFAVSVIVPKGAVVTPPETESGFGQAIVKEWNVKKVEKDRTDSLAFEYIVTTYTVEGCTIPQLSFVVQDGQKYDTLKSEPAILTIESVLSGDTVDIREMKDPQTAGKAPHWWILVVIGILGCGVAMVVASRYKKPTKINMPPPKPPYEEAVDALRELESKRYVQRGLIKEYVFELSEIWKRYIERRFEVNAAEFTSEEIIAWAGASALDKKLRSSLEWFFRTSDPVKFAKYIPDSETTDRFGIVIREFLEATKPVAAQDNQKPQEASSEIKQGVTA